VKIALITNPQANGERRPFEIGEALMQTVADSARKVLQAVWQWLRQVSGDAAYENYVRSTSQRSFPPLSREAFYCESLERKYARINRCC